MTQSAADRSGSASEEKRPSRPFSANDLRSTRRHQTGPSDVNSTSKRVLEVEADGDDGLVECASCSFSPNWFALAS